MKHRYKKEKEIKIVPSLGLIKVSMNLFPLLSGWNDNKPKILIYKNLSCFFWLLKAWRYLQAVSRIVTASTSGPEVCICSLSSDHVTEDSVILPSIPTKPHPPFIPSFLFLYGLSSLSFLSLNFLLFFSLIFYAEPCPSVLSHRTLSFSHRLWPSPSPPPPFPALPCSVWLSAVIKHRQPGADRMWGQTGRGSWGCVGSTGTNERGCEGRWGHGEVVQSQLLVVVLYIQYSHT